MFMNLALSDRPRFEKPSAIFAGTDTAARLI